jgi:DNA-binding CsgD family transcriptional regulator
VAYARERERVLRICDAAGDPRTVRLELLEAIRRVVGFDAYAWLVTDPETSVGCAPLADVPCLAQLPQLIRLKYLTTINRWTMLRGNARMLAEATGGDLSRSPLWRDLLRHYAVADIASAVYRDRFGCWGFLDLWRVGPSGRFGEADASFLDAIARPVTAALRRSLAGTFMGGGAPHQPVPPGPVVLLLSRDLEVRGQTPETQRYLRLLVPPAPEDRDIAVSIEETSPAERLALFARAFGLSAREAELVRQLAAGGGTRDLARQMFVSEHTVQDHLKSIFTKASVRSRRALLSRALGT